MGAAMGLVQVKPRTRFQTVGTPPTTPNALQILVESNSQNRAIAVKIKISCQDDKEKNIVLPATEIRHLHNREGPMTAMVLCKVDPSKANWCTGNKFTVEVSARETDDELIREKRGGGGRGGFGGAQYGGGDDSDDDDYGGAMGGGFGGGGRMGGMGGMGGMQGMGGRDMGGGHF